jgi:sterol desaturase/sphingolipid hydroxylase (fatty acid hydroxylase superfamily)
MQNASTILTVLLWPVVSIVVAPWEKQYWLYLGAAFVLAALVYVSRSRRPTFRGLSRYCLPWRNFVHPSAIADYKVWLINAPIFLALAPAFGFITAAAYGALLGTLRIASGTEGLHCPLSPFGISLATIIDLIALDAALFVAHYAQHRVPLLWEFHKVHHSARVLTPFTVFRMHPVDVLLNLSVGAAFGGVASAGLVFVFGTDPAITIFGINAIEFAFYIVGYHLRHSHVWIMFPGLIGRYVSSPALHLIHHSVEPRHWDKNLAQTFTFWDRLAGTLYLPTEREQLTFGIGDNKEADFATLFDLYFRPFRTLVSRQRAVRR